MNNIKGFVLEHIDDDTARLILDRGKWPGIDIELAVNCIESRRKLKGKVEEWYSNPDLVFPLKLSAEQCSSSLTARYKAELALKIVSSGPYVPSEPARSPYIADLTGGFGVDSWFFSKIASEVLYCERLDVLCRAATHNFAILGADNITIRNCSVVSEQAQKVSADGEDVTVAESVSVATLLSGFRPDIVYIDPARRGEGGRKVFLLEDCTPDVLTLKNEIFKFSRHLLIKLSPMADITMICDRLGNHCREVHIVGSCGECKELLVWMDREWEGEYSITAVEPSSDILSSSPALSFKPSEEKQAVATIAVKDEIYAAEMLFEPGKALMKSGGFNILCSRYGLKKLGKSTHYYIPVHEETHSAESFADLKALGKTFRILKTENLDRHGVRSMAAEFPKADVTARNLPMDTDTLRKKLGSASSDRYHIFGLKSDTAGNLLIATERH